MRNVAWLCGLGVIVLAVLGLAAPQADRVVLQPVRSAVLDVNPSGVNRVAFQFDLGGLRQGEGRRIEEAFLEWSVPGIPSDRMTEYSAYAATAEWATNADSTRTSVTVTSEPVAFWEISPADHQAGQGSRIRLDLQTLVQAWADSATANFGVVVCTRDLSAQTLNEQIDNASLVVRLGFATTE